MWQTGKHILYSKPAWQGLIRGGQVILVCWSQASTLGGNYESLCWFDFFVEFSSKVHSHWLCSIFTLMYAKWSHHCSNQWEVIMTLWCRAAADCLQFGGKFSSGSKCYSQLSMHSRAAARFIDHGVTIKGAPLIKLLICLAIQFSDSAYPVQLED